MRPKIGEGDRILTHRSFLQQFHCIKPLTASREQDRLEMCCTLETAEEHRLGRAFNALYLHFCKWVDAVAVLTDICDSKKEAIQAQADDSPGLAQLFASCGCPVDLLIYQNNLYRQAYSVPRPDVTIGKRLGALMDGNKLGSGKWKLCVTSGNISQRALSFFL